MGAVGLGGRKSGTIAMADLGRLEPVWIGRFEELLKGIL